MIGERPRAQASPVKQYNYATGALDQMGYGQEGRSICMLNARTRRAVGPAAQPHLQRLAAQSQSSRLNSWHVDLDVKLPVRCMALLGAWSGILASSLGLRGWKRLGRGVGMY